MSIADSFRKAFNQQVAELEKLAVYLHEKDIEQAVLMIANCTGSFLVMGLGKSGIIAQKISATFASLGVRSYFVHACDALHGDIGIAQENDVALLISNSGETSELLDVMAALRTRQIGIIVLTGNGQSSLAKRADCVLHAKIASEACPLNLAPTTSTSAALVIGDSLAIAVMEHRQVSKQQFALSHPAGRLGRRLTLKVTDLMHGGEKNPTIKSGEKWATVVTRIVDGQLGAVSVVDESEQLLGIITDGDIRRTLAKNSWVQLEALNAAQIMTLHPKSVFPTQTAVEALSIMTNNSVPINVLCVVDLKGRSVGLLRLSEISRAGL